MSGLLRSKGKGKSKSKSKGKGNGKGKTNTGVSPLRRAGSRAAPVEMTRVGGCGRLIETTDERWRQPMKGDGCGRSIEEPMTG
jgi:hypothetical protein